MNILFLTMYDQSGASSQVRVYQFIERFERNGISCTVKPLLTQDLIKQVQIFFSDTRASAKFFALIKILEAYIKRYTVVFSARNYDAVLVQKDVLPFGLQNVLFWANQNVIFEFDDAIWSLSPEQKKKNAIMQLFYNYQNRLFNRILIRSKIVIAENSYLATYAQRLNKNISIISAPIDTSRYRPTVISVKEDKIVLGWVGSKSTTYLLKSIKEALESVGSMNKNVELHNIGGDKFSLSNMLVKNIAWNENTIINELQKINIGLVPLDDSDLNKGRLSYKILIYFSVGIPTIAQRVGLNKAIIEDGKNGFLVESNKEWVESINNLINNEKLRHQLGEKARKVAIKYYDIEYCASKFIKLLHNVSK